MSKTLEATKAGERTQWDDPTYWQGVKVGQCQNCFRKDKAITRNGLCWICDTDKASPRNDMMCKCGSLLSAVNFECVRGKYCPES